VRWTSAGGELWRLGKIAVEKLGITVVVWDIVK